MNCALPLATCSRMSLSANRHPLRRDMRKRSHANFSRQSRSIEGMWRVLRRVIGTVAITALVLGTAGLVGAYVDVERRAVHAIIDPHPAVYAERKSPPKPTADRNGVRQT